MGLLYAIYKCIKWPLKVQVYFAGVLFTHKPSKLLIKSNNYVATRKHPNKPLGDQSNILECHY